MRRRLDACRHCRRPFGGIIERSVRPNLCCACNRTAHREYLRRHRLRHKGIPTENRNGNGIFGQAAGPESWPESKEDPVMNSEKRARALRYHADVLAGRPIAWIPAGERLTTFCEGDPMKHEEPTETCQWCEHLEQETCVNTESDYWNMRRGAGCTCDQFHQKECRKRKAVAV